MTGAGSGDGPGLAGLRNLAAVAAKGTGTGPGAWHAVLQWDFADEGAAYLVVSADSVTCAVGRHIKPTVVVSGRGKDLERCLRGEVDMTQLLARGEATAHGRYRDVIELGRLTSAVKKQRLRSAAVGAPSGATGGS